MIITCKKNKHKQDLIRETWLKSINYPYVFVIGDESIQDEYFLDGDVLYVKCNDTYDYLTRKVYKSIRIINSLFNPKFLLKIDDDLYIELDLFKKVIEKSLKQRVQYGGLLVCFESSIRNLNYSKFNTFPKHETDIDKIHKFIYTAGPVYLLGKDALDCFSNSNKIDITFTYMEDIDISIFLSKFGIYPMEINIVTGDKKLFDNGHIPCFHTS